MSNLKTLECEGVTSHNKSAKDYYYIVKEIENDEEIQTESFDRKFLYKVVELSYYLGDMQVDFSYDELIDMLKAQPSLTSVEIAKCLEEKDLLKRVNQWWSEELSDDDKIELYRKYNK